MFWLMGPTVDPPQKSLSKERALVRDLLALHRAAACMASSFLDHS